MQVVDETVVLPQFLLVEKIVAFPEVFDIPVVAQMWLPMVLQTIDSTARHGTARHGTAQHSTAQHSTPPHSTAQHSTAQHTHHTTPHHTTPHHTTTTTTTPPPLHYHHHLHVAILAQVIHAEGGLSSAATADDLEVTRCLPTRCHQVFFPSSAQCLLSVFSVGLWCFDPPLEPFLGEVCRLCRSAAP